MGVYVSPGTLLFVGARQAVSWFVAFVGLVAVSAAIDPALAAGAPYIPSGVVIIFFALNILGVTTTAYALLQYFVRAREREEGRSERLLLNVLPEPVAARLKQDDGIIADAREDVTVLFADIVGFRVCLNGSPPRTSSRCWTACSPAGTRSPPRTVSRRSRQSAMPTWSPEADLDYLQERLPQAFTRMSDGIDRVSTIVKAMKSFAHHDARDMAPADLNDGIRTTLMISRNEYKYIAELRTELQDLPPVLCNIGDLNQVLLNLVVNAAHAIQDSPGEDGKPATITVTSHLNNQQAIVRVADTGCGMPAEIRERIFEPFFTTKRSRTRQRARTRHRPRDHRRAAPRHHRGRITTRRRQHIHDRAAHTRARRTALARALINTAATIGLSERRCRSRTRPLAAL